MANNAPSTEFKFPSSCPLLVPASAVTGGIMDTQYLGVWIYLSNFKQLDCLQDIADGIGASLGFVRAAMDHFEDIGCLLHEHGVSYVSELPFTLHEQGITDLSTIRSHVRNERDNPRPRQACSPEQEPTPIEEFVYVVGVPGGRVVKIGRTSNVERRVRSLQTSSPNPVELLWCGRGGPDVEGALHRQFGKYRVHGEWFDFGRANPVQRVSAAAMSLGAVAVAE